jgi:triacylglycerol lipase
MTMIRSATDAGEAGRPRLLRDPSLPIWRELCAWMEWIELRQSSVYQGNGVPTGSGEQVILVPGFLGSGASLSELRRWLLRMGYRVAPSGIDRNLDCPDVTLPRLLEATETAAQAGKARVHLIGHSLGGTLSRAAAVRRPDLIRQVITLGSPIRQVIAHPLVVSLAEFIESHLPSPDEGPRRHDDHFHDGTCFCETFAALSQPFPEEVQRTAVYTLSDGVIDWRTAIEEEAEYNVQVKGSHLGLVVNREVYQAIGWLLSKASEKRSRAAQKLLKDEKFRNPE